MSTQWNEKASQSVAKKMARMKEELGTRSADTDNMAEILERIHPEISPDSLHHGIQEISEGIEQLFQVETERINESSVQILDGQMEGMTEEQKKGFLCQLFNSVKLSDEAMDSEIENARVDSTYLAQMSMEELQALVSEQLINSIKGMTINTLEDNLEEIAGMDAVSLRTREDAFLLATAQYSEALEGNISFEYTRVPRVLGQCAAAQTRITQYCDGIARSELSEDEKINQIVEIITTILAVLVLMVFSVVLGIAVGGVAGALMTVTFEAVAAFLGTGIIAFIAELVLLYPIIWISFAVVAGAGALVYFAGKGIYELLKAVAPKIKEFYNKLAAGLNSETPVNEDEENYDSTEEYWDDQDDELDEEDNELAYT